MAIMIFSVAINKNKYDSIIGHLIISVICYDFFFFHKWSGNTNQQIVFDTLSGELCNRLSGDRIVMDFPLYTSTHQVRLQDLESECTT